MRARALQTLRPLEKLVSALPLAMLNPVEAIRAEHQHALLRASTIAREELPHPRHVPHPRVYPNAYRGHISPTGRLTANDANVVNFALRCAEDDTPFPVWLWRARESSVPLKGLIVICHGFNHRVDGGWRSLALELAAEGFAVAGFDQPGHGSAVGMRGYIPSFDRLATRPYTVALAALEHLKADPVAPGAVRSEGTRLPVFLLGESMGGATALTASLQQPGFWAGVMCLAPMAGIHPTLMPPDWQVRLLQLLASWFPTLPLVPTRDFTSMCYKDPAMRLHVMNDTITRYKGKLRLSTGLSLLDGSTTIQARAAEISVPSLCIMHGTADLVCCVDHAADVARAAASPDTTFVAWAGAWHGLLNEPSDTVQRLARDACTWFASRAAGAQEAYASGQDWQGVPGHRWYSRPVGRAPWWYELQAGSRPQEHQQQLAPACSEAENAAAAEEMSGQAAEHGTDPGQLMAVEEADVVAHLAREGF